MIFTDCKLEALGFAGQIDFFSSLFLAQVKGIEERNHQLPPEFGDLGSVVPARRQWDVRGGW